MTATAENPPQTDRPEGTVGKALLVLDQVAAAGGPARFSELAAASPYPKATLHRLLSTLVAENMLVRSQGGQTYALGPRLLRLAHSAWTRSSLAEAAAPVLDRLAGEVGEILHLATLDAGQVLYLAKRSPRPVEMFSSVGKVGPAYCTGVGKAMLAFMSEKGLEEALSRQAFRPFTPNTHKDAASLRRDLEAIRKAGFAEDREEHEPGINCVAVPILSASGALYGALSATGFTHTSPLTTLRAYLPKLQSAAAEIATAAEIRLTPPI